MNLADYIRAWAGGTDGRSPRVIYRDEAGVELDWTAASAAMEERGDLRLETRVDSIAETLRVELDLAPDGLTSDPHDRLEFVLKLRGEVLGRAQAYRREAVGALRGLLAAHDLLGNGASAHDGPRSA